MSVHAFRFDSTRFRNAFAPRKPRHPLVRMALGLLGIGLLVVLVFFSVFVGAAMIAGGLLYRVVRQWRKPAARNARIVDAEYDVVRKTTPVLPLSR
ncbi:MAG: hypothetical protein M3Q96_06560 [Pseudomonadota bacterium]|nr:hypothetical protein [Pseudomonadota bacterium]MDQ3229950.1 hypothetical protein [Pseudomonadota bacterium]